MGRGSFISVSSIERLCGSIRHSQQIQQRNALIQSQFGIEKEKPVVYTLQNVDFNIDTRVCRIEILQTQQYRTIEKYVTRDYQKYPIYSSWKTKTKIIKKTIKLTNIELESLNVNSDPLIRQFADKIILSLNNEELLPSWLIIKYLRLQLKEKLHSYDIELTQFENKTNLSISKHKSYIQERKGFIEDCNTLVLKLQKDWINNYVH